MFPNSSAISRTRGSICKSSITRFSVLSFRKVQAGRGISWNLFMRVAFLSPTDVTPVAEKSVSDWRERETSLAIESQGRVPVWPRCNWSRAALAAERPDISYHSVFTGKIGFKEWKVLEWNLANCMCHTQTHIWRELLFSFTCWRILAAISLLRR
jgi:hypothetical protein